MLVYAHIMIITNACRNTDKVKCNSAQKEKGKNHNPEARILEASYQQGIDTSFG